MSLKLKTSYIIKSFILRYYTINGYGIILIGTRKMMMIHFVFYFILIQERHIFYTINKNNLKKIG